MQLNRRVRTRKNLKRTVISSSRPVALSLVDSAIKKKFRFMIIVHSCGTQPARAKWGGGQIDQNVPPLKRRVEMRVFTFILAACLVAVSVSVPTHPDAESGKKARAGKACYVMQSGVSLCLCMTIYHVQMLIPTLPSKTLSRMFTSLSISCRITLIRLKF